MSKPTTLAITQARLARARRRVARRRAHLLAELALSCAHPPHDAPLCLGCDHPPHDAQCPRCACQRRAWLDQSL